MNMLPLFSYPLIITLIDDDPLILQSLTALLKNDCLLKTFDNPQKAIQFFNDYQPTSSSIKLLRGCTELENYDVSGHLPVDINLGSVKKLFSNPLRSSEISIIIVDYNMPEMNGIDLCRNLKHLPVKKILLTGDASDQLAINAFNEGIIDCFIKKESLSLSDDIRFHIEVLMQQYLENNSKQLLKHLETDHQLPPFDPVFITFFKKWCRTHQIKEYLIIDQNSNFLLINEDNEESFFIIHTDRTLNNFIDLHEEDTDVACFVNAVKSREKIPFFGYGKESWDINFSEWNTFFVTPNVLIGREKYYWTMINKSKALI